MTSPPPTHDLHAHDVGLDATVDLINTYESDLAAGVMNEHLGTVEAAVDFLDAHGLGHAAELRRQADNEGGGWLGRVHDARVAIRDLWDATVEGRAPSAVTVALINDLLDRSPRPILRTTLAGVAVSHRHPEDDPTGEALARAAAPLVDSIAAGTTARLRICANDDCRWVFEDESRAGRRRWCDMSTCGNQAKVRRFRARRREGATGDPGATA
jgi:predicted RNA-binding Zn ribbon-like protein